ncbi:MAG: hypothetical protein OYG31_00590 [Candidatus Kaiserbacteria bacterium]|nr:hypothetical protein [Candidatus Kaiserbacteria bacterium]
MMRFIGKHWPLLLSIALLGIVLFTATTDVWAQSASDDFTETMFEVAGKLFGWFADSILNPLFDICRTIFLSTFNFTIIDFGSYWSSDGPFSGLSGIWGIFRDLVNIVIVILFIFSSILTILSESAFGINRTKTLLALVGAAVFVNFSGFIAFFLVDLSHVILIIFGDQVFDANTFAKMDVFEEEINLAIGLSSLSTQNAFPLLYSFSKMIVYTFLSVGFLAFSLLLIERFLFAIVLILTSPIAFLGFFVKKSGMGSSSPGSFIARGYSEWLNRFSHITIVPIIIIFGLAIIIYIYEAVFRSVMESSGVNEALINSVASASGSSGSTDPGVVKMLVGTTIANSLLIYGFFKVYAMAKNTYVYKAGAPVTKKTLNVAKGVTKSLLPSLRSGSGTLGSRLESGLSRLSSAAPSPGSGTLKTAGFKVLNKVGDLGSRTTEVAKTVADTSARTARGSAQVIKDTRDFSKAIYEGRPVQEVFEDRRKEDLKQTKDSVSVLLSKIHAVEQMAEYYKNTGGTLNRANLPPQYGKGGWQGGLKSVRGSLNRAKNLDNPEAVKRVIEQQEKEAETIYNAMKEANASAFTAEFKDINNETSFVEGEGADGTGNQNTDREQPESEKGKGSNQQKGGESTDTSSNTAEESAGGGQGADKEKSKPVSEEGAKPEQEKEGQDSPPTPSGDTEESGSATEKSEEESKKSESANESAGKEQEQNDSSAPSGDTGGSDNTAEKPAEESEEPEEDSQGTDESSNNNSAQKDGGTENQ